MEQVYFLEAASKMSLSRLSIVRGSSTKPAAISALSNTCSATNLDTGDPVPSASSLEPVDKHNKRAIRVIRDVQDGRKKLFVCITLEEVDNERVLWIDFKHLWRQLASFAHTRLFLWCILIGLSIMQIT